MFSFIIPANVTHILASGFKADKYTSRNKDGKSSELSAPTAPGGRVYAVLPLMHLFIHRQS